MTRLEFVNCYHYSYFDKDITIHDEYQLHHWLWNFKVTQSSIPSSMFKRYITFFECLKSLKYEVRIQFHGLFMPALENIKNLHDKYW